MKLQPLPRGRRGVAHRIHAAGTRLAGRPAGVVHAGASPVECRRDFHHGLLRLSQERFAHQGSQLRVGRKSLVVLARDPPVIHPDAEFPAPADFKRRVEAGVLFDERRHTGGARQVVSNLAVADANHGHTLSSHFSPPALAG